MIIIIVHIKKTKAARCTQTATFACNCFRWRARTAIKGRQGYHSLSTGRGRLLTEQISGTSLLITTLFATNVWFFWF